MKNLIKKIFPVIAFAVAFFCAWATTMADVNSSAIFDASIYSPGQTPACIMVGTCQTGGSSICTDQYGHQLHRYNSESGTCFPYALGSFFEEVE